MQLRKVLRILNEIKEKYGDHIQVSVQADDFKTSCYQLHEVSEVGISEAFYEDKDGWTRDTSRFVVSLGLENPNYKSFK